MTQALYRKWRPRKWDQVVAQEHVIQTLRNAIKNDRVGHAYLFSGPRGTGKTTTARLLAKAVNCLSPDLENRPCDECKNCLAVNEGRFLDLIEIDAASNTSVEDVRDLRDKINFSPTDGRYKVYIIDEVHMLSTAAFNAILKTLEEPPPHAIFILATTEVHKIPATVMSRCQRHEFRRIPVKDIVSTLEELCRQEHIHADEEALLLIARQSTGALRDAISLLDQLASTGQKIDLELAQEVLGTATNDLVLKLVDSIQKNDMAQGLETIHKALDSGSDPRQYARQVVDYLRGLLLVSMGNEKQVEATKETRNLMRQQSQLIGTPALMEWISHFNEGINDLRTSWQPGLPLEIAFAKCLPLEAQVTAQSVRIPEVSMPVHVDPVPAPVDAREPVIASVESEKQAAKKSEPIATETPAPTGQDDASASDQGLNSADIQAAWSQIRAEVKQRHPQTEALLNSQRLLQVKNGKLILGFSSEVLKSKMENEENIAVTREMIKKVLQRDIDIQCIVVGSKAGIGAEDPDIDADGMVRAAISMGGKLIKKN
ncbi:MAG TPA: DNA polymerase III subunit gamma/tau [Anaerolineaceae bacterium]|nr:DNA polymerase III subunit gamma/tau [Anaerolineaceae bacterium]